MPITLTELAFLMFFLLLLLFVGGMRAAHEEEEKQAERIEQLESVTVELRERAVIVEEAMETFQIEELEDFRELVAQSAEAWQRNEQLEAQLTESTEDLQECQGSQETVRRQVEHFRQRLGKGGRDYPPCWLDPAGKIEYIYEVTIRESDLGVARVWPSNRDAEARVIPGAVALVGDSWSLSEFRRRAAPILEWSKQRDCRHYVRIIDEAVSKESFKTRLLTVEGYFYKYLAPDAGGGRSP